MAKYRELANPPIAEVVLDVQFLADESQSAEGLEPLTHKLFDGIHGVAPQYSFEAHLTAIPEKDNVAVESGSRKLIGYLVTNAAANRIFALGADRLSVVQRPPYAGWESMVADLRRVFDVFTKERKPRSVKRIAARFTNSFRAPLEKISLEELFNWSLGLPSEIQMDIVEFNHRTVIQDSEERLFAIVTFKDTKATSPENGGHFTLDIDAISGESIAVSFEAVEERLAKIRNLKNQIFFSSVTEKALEPYT